MTIRYATLASPTPANRLRPGRRVDQGAAHPDAGRTTDRAGQGDLAPAEMLKTRAAHGYCCRCGSRRRPWSAAPPRQRRRHLPGHHPARTVRGAYRARGRLHQAVAEVGADVPGQAGELFAGVSASAGSRPAAPALTALGNRPVPQRPCLPGPSRHALSEAAHFVLCATTAPRQ